MIQRRPAIFASVILVTFFISMFGASAFAQDKKKTEPQKGKAHTTPGAQPGTKRGVSPTTRPDAKKKDEAKKDDALLKHPAPPVEDAKKNDDAEREARNRDGEKVNLGEGVSVGADDDVIAKESKKHAERLAKAERLKEVALEMQDQKLLEQVERMTAKEKERHVAALARIADGKGGSKGDAKKPDDKKDVDPRGKDKKPDAGGKPKEKKSDAPKKSKDAPTSAPKDKKPANSKKN